MDLSSLLFINPTAAVIHKVTSTIGCLYSVALTADWSSPKFTSPHEHIVTERRGQKDRDNRRLWRVLSDTRVDLNANTCSIFHMASYPTGSISDAEHCACLI